MLTGLARDGGLYARPVPVLPMDRIAAMAGLSYEEVALSRDAALLGDAFTDAEFAAAIARAYAGFGHPPARP
jgi:threonine synthase